MRLWKIFLIIDVVLSVMGWVLLPVSQIRSDVECSDELRTNGEVVRVFYVLTNIYPFNWLMLPAVIIVTIGIVSLVYAYLVKRTYG